MRARPGDVFYAIDGSGLKYRAVVSSMTRNTVVSIITTTTRLENEPFVQVTLAQGVCRPSKMDEIIERGTEIGVSAFVFYYSEKTYSRAGEELSKGRKLSRMIRIARSAAKQSKRSIIPSVATLTGFSELVCLKSQFDIALLATTSPNSGTIESNLERGGAAKKILLLVGPESGLSENEEAACLAAGFVPTSLGPRRLRTETAGIIFPALVLHHLGDL